MPQHAETNARLLVQTPHPHQPLWLFLFPHSNKTPCDQPPKHGAPTLPVQWHVGLGHNKNPIHSQASECPTVTRQIELHHPQPPTVHQKTSQDKMRSKMCRLHAIQTRLRSIKSVYESMHTCSQSSPANHPNHDQ